MNRGIKFLLLPLSASAVLAAGCLITTSGTRLVRKNEQRQPIEFESEAGLIEFNNAVQRRGTAGARNRGRSSFNLPFLVSADRRHVLSWPAYFNDQVQLADVNADGLLSDAEVTAYVGN